MPDLPSRVTVRPHSRTGNVTELPPGHTAVCLCWTQPDGQPLPPGQHIDRTFVLPGILQGMQLDDRLDTLLDEHVTGTDAALELCLWWHYEDGHWETSTVPARFGRYAL